MNDDLALHSSSTSALSTSSHTKILEFIRLDSLDHRRYAVERRRTSCPAAIAAADDRSLSEEQNGLSITERRYDCIWLHFGSEMEQLRQCLATDGLAGRSVGLLVMPQSLCYAALAGLLVQYGLYATFMPLNKTIFNSSKYMRCTVFNYFRLRNAEGSAATR